jgi:hypothetical protein
VFWRRRKWRAVKVRLTSRYQSGSAGTVTDAVPV